MLYLLCYHSIPSHNDFKIVYIEYIILLLMQCYKIIHVFRSFLCHLTLSYVYIKYSSFTKKGMECEEIFHKKNLPDAYQVHQVYHNDKP